MLKKHSHFLKDLTSVRITDRQFEKLISYLVLLSKGENLPEEARNHQLVGKYKDCNEFHVGGDLIVIYMKIKKDVIVLRIGTHSKLFE